MDGLFARLAQAVAGPSADTPATDLRPVLRGTSPVFEDDPAFWAAGPDEETQAGFSQIAPAPQAPILRSPEVPASGATDTVMQAPLPTRVVFDLPTAEREGPVPGSAVDPVPPAVPPEDPFSPPGRSGDDEPASGVSVPAVARIGEMAPGRDLPADLPATPAIPATRPAAEPALHLADADGSPPAHAQAEVPMEPVVARMHRAEAVAAAPALHPVPPVPARSAPVPLTPPSVRSGAEAPDLAPRTIDPVAALPLPDTPPAPQTTPKVEIGRLVVEIQREPPEPPRQAGPPAPRTAAEASQIGPIGVLRGGIYRFSGF